MKRDVLGPMVGCSPTVSIGKHRHHGPWLHSWGLVMGFEGRCSWDEEFMGRHEGMRFEARGSSGSLQL